MGWYTSYCRLNDCIRRSAVLEMLRFFARSHMAFPMTSPTLDRRSSWFCTAFLARKTPKHPLSRNHTLVR